MLCIVWLVDATVATQMRTQPDRTAVEDETMRHHQALLRLDTSNPPGDERLVVDYVAGVLKREGIPFEIRAVDPGSPEPSDD